MPRRYVAVCGASEATPSQLHAAREVGRLLARHGAVCQMKNFIPWCTGEAGPTHIDQRD